MGAAWSCTGLPSSFSFCCHQSLSLFTAYFSHLLLWILFFLPRHDRSAVSEDELPSFGRDDHGALVRNLLVCHVDKSLWEEKEEGKERRPPFGATMRELLDRSLRQV